MFQFTRCALHDTRYTPPPLAQSRLIAYNYSSMSPLRLKSRARALVIVAHPDDETIWMGGTILEHPEIDWTIFSVCRLSDNDRRPKFRRVCRYYGARSIMADFDDEGRLGVDESIAQIAALIRSRLKGHKFDYVFTHGANGDYGHARHIGVHRAVKSLAEEGYFDARSVFYFSYQKNGKKSPSMAPHKEAKFKFELKKDIYQEKRRIVAEMHGYPYEGIDVNLCTEVEAFTK